jgi:hypothetical protein
MKRQPFDIFTNHQIRVAKATLKLTDLQLSGRRQSRSPAHSQEARDQTQGVKVEARNNQGNFLTKKGAVLFRCSTASGLGTA